MKAHPGAPLIERFWKRVDTSSDCWVWIGTRQAQGYGEVSLDVKRKAYAHRIAYEMAYGSIPPDLSVLHRCDNPPCVRPTHLFLGTQSDNAVDMWAKGRGKPPPLHEGERQHSAKLTADDVTTIRALSASGMTSGALAKQYGVTVSNVRRILLRQTWKSVA